MTFFGVEDCCSADRAKPELEPGSLIANAKVLSCGAKYFIRCGKAGQCCEDTARPALTGEAVANAHSEWLALDFNAQLAAGT